MDEKQVFNELGLFPKLENSDEKVVKWWTMVSNFARTLENNNLSEIGNNGEFLSINYEFERTRKNAKTYGFRLK